MDIHKPKPVHSWRELLGEVGVIVIGIAIALTGEQVIETLQWKHKVADAETAMHRELGTDLAYAAERLAMKDCASQYFTRMETAVRSRRTDTLRQLAAMGAPFTLQPWRIQSWTAALSSEIPDRIARDKLSVYALMFTAIETQGERQATMADHYDEVVAGRLIDNPTPEIVYAQLTALEKLKAEYGLTLLISDALLHRNAPQLGVSPDMRMVANDAADPARCEKQLAAIPQ